MTTVLYNGVASKIHEAFQESKYSGTMIYTAFADAYPTQRPLRAQKKASRRRSINGGRRLRLSGTQKERARPILPPRHSRSGNSATAAASSLARRTSAPGSLRSRTLCQSQPVIPTAQTVGTPAAAV